MSGKNMAILSNSLVISGVKKITRPKILCFISVRGINHSRTTKRFFYANYYIVSQINQCLNQPENLSSYEFKENEAKIYRPRYDTAPGQFLGLDETLGYLMVGGDSDECFFDYGFSRENSKNFSSYHKKRMLNSFLGTFFNRHRIQYESGALNTEFSKIYFFLPSITDRIEDINRHMGSVNLIPKDISQESFEVEGGIDFDPSKLDYGKPDREKNEAGCSKCSLKSRRFVRCKYHKNVDGLMSKKSVDQDVEWVGEKGKRVPENPYKMSY